jgi:hypothetical protein
MPEGFAMTVQTSLVSEERFAPLLGSAVIHVWAELPREVQEKLFEHAVVIGHHGERDENLREQLAQFLHDRHRRSQQGEEQARA